MLVWKDPNINFFWGGCVRDEPLIWISAAEASADLHGGLLMRALARRGGYRVCGMAGESMRAAAQELAPQVESDFGFGAEELSVMGFTEVVQALPRVLSVIRRVRRELAMRRPDVVVCIDSPDFHFRVVKTARMLRIPTTYYISPQLWAWRQSRVRFLKDNVDALLCILPFEPDFYARWDYPVEYVGHPLVEAMPLHELDRIEPDSKLIGLLPGSRRKEISAVLPEFARAARILDRLHAGLRFRLFRAPGMDESYLRSFLPERFPIETIEPADRYRGIRECALVMATSGTATLESAIIGTPAIIAYKGSALSYAIAERVVSVNCIGLPNLVLDRQALPELVQDLCDSRCLARVADAWLSHPGALAELRARLGDVRARLSGGGIEKAADVVLGLIRQRAG
jgi:lipid-A-disaccharide synthase